VRAAAGDQAEQVDLGRVGVGRWRRLWGRTDDKVITFFAFAVMAFFAILVTVLSLIQIRLESRKERLRRELERLRPPAAQ
jgi:hypothetical protein